MEKVSPDKSQAERGSAEEGTRTVRYASTRVTAGVTRGAMPPTDPSGEREFAQIMRRIENVLRNSPPGLPESLADELSARAKEIAATRGVQPAASACDMVDPTGRDAKALDDTATSPRPASARGTDAEPAKTDDSIDLAKLLFPEGRAAIIEHRECHVRESHFGGRDFVLLTVSTYTGNGSPNETADTVLQIAAFADRPDGLEYACRRMCALGRELDPLAKSVHDYSSSTFVEERAKAAADEAAKEG